MIVRWRGLGLLCKGEGRQEPLHVLAFVEAFSVSGTAKPVLEAAREARVAGGGRPEVKFSILTFLRNGDNLFTAAVEAEGLPLVRIRECGRFDARIVPQLRAAVRRLQPDVVWTNSAKSHFLARAAGLNRAARWLAYHHGYTSSAWVNRAYDTLDRWSMPAAVLVATVCRSFAEDLLKRRGVRRERLRIQPVPIRRMGRATEAERAAARKRLGIEEGRPVWLNVGRLSAEKGQDQLLHALAESRRDGGSAAQLLIAGEGPGRQRLEALARQLELGPESVRLLGFQNDVRPLYAAADVFVLPSHSEGSPNVLLEAMDAGVPIVATRVGGVPEMVTSEKDALLVNDFDVTGMAKAVVRVLGDRALREQLRSGAETILQRYAPETFFANLCGMFSELISTPGAA